MAEISLKELEKKIGYMFHDIRMLRQAMCHSSYANEHRDTQHDNERLEFLGDAVLEVTSSDVLYHQYQEMPEGQLTKLRASIGAIYLDGGFANAKEFVEKFILTDIEHKKLFYDSKTILQEIVQRDFKDEEIRYVITGEEGPDHAKQFLVEVMIGKNAMGSGRGSTKKSAEQEAAYRAIIGLKGKTEDVSEKH